MPLFFTLFAIVALSCIAVFLIRSIVETGIDLRVAMKEGKAPDRSKQKHSIVYNKKTQKLEADQSLILPF